MILPRFGTNSNPLQLVVAYQGLIGCEKKPARPAGRIGYGLVGFGLHTGHNRFDERAWGEVLACTRFGVLSVLLEDALVDIPFRVGVQTHPLVVVDHVDDPSQFRWILDFVLRRKEMDDLWFSFLGNRCSCGFFPRRSNTGFFRGYKASGVDGRQLQESVD